MNSFDWESFLRQWSQEILESIDRDRESLPPEVIESSWLGYAGATEEQIAQAEARLGSTLPPSYRAFLKVSNGWRQTTPFINRLWSVEEIEWFATRHQDWIDAWSEKSGHFSSKSPDDNAVTLSVSDKEYFVYGDEQDCSKIRIEYLQTALEISKRGEAAIYLLNPQVVTAEGEWEGWFLGDWLPGADRYPSFQAMMQAEYESFLDLRETPPRSVSASKVGQTHSISTTADPSSHSSNMASRKPKSTPKPAPLQEAKPVLKAEPVPKLESVSEIESALEAEPSELKNTTLSIPGSPTEGQELASFFIAFQTSQIQGQTEQQTIVRHVETNVVETYPGLNLEAAYGWISEQLKTVLHQASLNQSVEPEPAVLEITQLRLIRSQAEPSMMVNQTQPLFPKAIGQGEPFTLEVSLKLADSAQANPSQPLVYQTQCFVHHLSTQSETCLGDVTTETPFDNRSAHAVLIPNISLPQPGVYRLKVWVSPQNMAASPAYFKVPVLQVI